MAIQKLYFIVQLKKHLLTLVIISFLTDVTAQDTHFTPALSKVFTPFLINPAIAGSKDFFAIELAAVIQGSEKAQILSGNTRIAKKGPKYFGVPELRDYSRIGIGASLFNDLTGTSRNIGFSTAASWHLPLSKTNLSFLSGGIAIKGFYNHLDKITDFESNKRGSFIPGIDAGVYYYGQKIYAGISITNILGHISDSIGNGSFEIPVSRHYFFITGYKFILSRSMNIMMEPSLIINVDDSLKFNIIETYNPMLTLYMDDFCIGTYLHDYDKLTFFFKYRFPGLYLGALVDFPKNTPFFKKELIVEISLGVKIGNWKSASRGKWHW
jgi:type IX secretion system PorP/SprF family membrane protein